MEKYDNVVKALMKQPIVGGLLIVSIFLGLYFIFLGLRVALIQKRIDKNK